MGEYLLLWLEQQSDWTAKKRVEVQPTRLYQELQAILKDAKVDLKSVKFPGAPHILTRRLNTLKSNMADNGIFYFADRGKDRHISFTHNSVESDNSDASDDKKGDATGDARQKDLSSSDAIKKPSEHSDGDSVNQNTDDSDAKDAIDATLSDTHTDNPIVAFLKAQEEQRAPISAIATALVKTEGDTLADLQAQERIGDVFSPRHGVWALVHHEAEL